jgi:polyphosphate kinase
VFKLNHLVDPDIIDELYAASQSGCQIDLVVRGMCSLRALVPGLSDNIRVRSIVGRFLEHSRVYRFGHPEDGAAYYLGSADMMQRNLDHRVETVTPVQDPLLRRRLEEMLEVNLADDMLAWEMQPDGSWEKVPTVEGVNTHDRLWELALERARGAR